MLIRGIYRTFYCLLTFLLLNACSKNERDDSVPNIRIESPFEDAQFFGGDTLRVRIELTDNQELGEVTLRVRDNRYEFPEDAPSNLFIWDTTIVNRLFGRETDIEVSIPIPINIEAIPGILMVKANDNSGNETDWQRIIFNLLPEQDISPPQINLDTESVLTLTGSIFAIIGEVSDDQSLERVGLEMRQKDQEEILYQKDHNELESANFSIEEFIEAPTAPGSYELTVFAFDETSNSDFVVVPIEIQ